MVHIDYTGRTLENRYRILKRLGGGGMGAVYLGQHLVIDRMVAVKFLHGEFVGKATALKRFQQEAKAAVAVRHRNIINVLDMGVSDEKEPYLVMEY